MTSWRAWTGLLLALAWVAPAAAQPGAGEVLSIEAAVSRALEANRGLQTTRSEIDGLSDRIEAARTRKYPVLSARLLEGVFLKPLEATFPAGAFGGFGALGPFPPSDTTVRSDTRVLRKSLGRASTRRPARSPVACARPITSCSAPRRRSWRSPSRSRWPAS